MTTIEKLTRTCFLLTLVWLPVAHLRADGGYVSKTESVAISTDQRAIIIKDGKQISMTFSTGYTGDGQEFGWIIPTPVPPAMEDVYEAGEDAEAAFDILDRHSAPVVTEIIGGCFPAGTEVITVSGPQAIETIVPGTEVHTYDLSAREWVLKHVLERLEHRYEGDMITVQLGEIMMRATGNHPFYVLQGEQINSRPLPQDVPMVEQRVTDRGRWVEARDLKPGDTLLGRSGEGLVITAVSSRYENTEVYNLEIEDYHNYAVHRKGLLVHNKGGLETSGPNSLITVYSTVTLQHYEVSVLGAAAAASLLEWLQQNDYQVDPTAQEVLDTYVRRNWAFVAAKLNPTAKRHYENEFLPPLTIRHQHDRLIFPLRISSVSTTHPIKITLYVLGESTVTSSNFPTINLDYERRIDETVAPEIYIESCIRNSIGDDRRGFAVMWGGEFAPSPDEQKTISALRRSQFPGNKQTYLTRLETRLNTESMVEDVNLMLDPQPNEFRVATESPGWGRADEAVEAQDRHGITDLMYAVLDSRDTDELTPLLKAGADVNAQDSLGVTSLMYAARYNQNPQVISALLKAGADVSVRNIVGESAIFYAVKNRNPEVISTLLEAGADVNERDNLRRTVLMEAVTEGYSEAVKILLEAGADVKVRHETGSTPLISAAGSGHIEIVRLLLQSGADANVGRETGRTPLRSAAGSGHTEIVKLLLQSSADVNVGREAGWETPLMDAVGGGHTEIVKLLLQSGADVNAGRSNYEGETALIMAAGGGSAELVKILLDAGADVSARDDDGETALWHAARSNRNPQVTAALLNAGADANERDNRRRMGWTVLMEAASRGNTEAVKDLLEAGARVNAKNDYGVTALLQAADGGPPEVVRILLDAGADLSARADLFGTTALMYAVSSGDAQVVQILLEAGADLNAHDDDGKSALMYAREEGHTEIVDLLLEAGAKE